MLTANDRFKLQARDAFWYALAGATVLHFVLLTHGPTFALERFDRDAPQSLHVQPPDVELPPPPDAIPRPAFPAVTDAALEPLASFPTFSFDDYVPPPPPAASSAGAAAAREQFERFVPSMTAPRIRNVAAVERSLRQHYPALLREAGIAGRVELDLWLDERGRIVRVEVAHGSGYEAMDAAALRVAEVMELTPAENRGRAVAVIVRVPVVFRVTAR